MDTIWKIVLSFIAVIIITVSGIGITMSNVDVVNANNYLDEVSTVISASNYNQEVIDACIEEAANNGYQLEVSVIGSSMPGTKRYAEVVFRYTYELPVFELSIDKTKRKIL